MNKKKIVVSVLGILGIVLATIGVTYAFFSYSKTGTKENSITSGKVTFLYTESSQGITLTDAMPMTDDQGKAQTGEGKVFDFRVTSSVGANMRIPYIVTVKPDSSVIPAEYIKLYLTDQSDNEIESVRTLASLDNYTNTITGLTGEKVLYEGEVPAGNSNYNKLFRLRMWIADNIDMNEGNTGIGTYNGASFSIKVNVYGEGEATNQTEAERRANASIESVTVSGSNVTVVDDTHFTVDALVQEGEASATVPILVDTVNDNATVKVERIDNQSSNINESKVKKIAVTNNVTIYPGTNQFKITVTPEDKSDPTIYYLTITGVAKIAGVYNENNELILAWNDIPSCSVTIEEGYGKSRFEDCFLNTIGRSTKYKLVVPNSVTKIGRKAFNESNNLISIDIPSSVTQIDSLAFFYARYLTQVNLSDGLLSIGANAFSGIGMNTNTSIEFYIPSTVNSIYGFRSFASIKSPNISKYIADPNSQYFASTADGVLFDKSFTTLVAYPNASSLTTYNIPSSVTLIGGYAFWGANNLQEIIFPNEDSNRWYYLDKSGGTQIDVSDSSTNATNFVSNYYKNEWLYK